MIVLIVEVDLLHNLAGLPSCSTLSGSMEMARVTILAAAAFEYCILQSLLKYKVKGRMLPNNLFAENHDCE